jgi:hypothetical protein
LLEDEDLVFLALLEARAEREIAGRKNMRIIEEKIFCLERENNEYRYQTAEGEENVDSTDENENSGGAIEVIETSNVS